MVQKKKKNRNLNSRLSVNESDCMQLLVYAFMSWDIHKYLCMMQSCMCSCAHCTCALCAVSIITVTQEEVCFSHFDSDKALAFKLTPMVH